MSQRGSTSSNRSNHLNAQLQVPTFALNRPSGASAQSQTSALSINAQIAAAGTGSPRKSTSSYQRRAKALDAASGHARASQAQADASIPGLKHRATDPAEYMDRVDFNVHIHTRASSSGKHR